VNFVSHYLKGLNPLSIASVSISFLIIPTAIILWQVDFFSLPFDVPVMQIAMAEASFLGIVGTAIATILFYMLIQRSGGIFASMVIYAIPFVGILWGYFDGEKITWLTILGLLVMLTGVYLANKSENKTS
jgi:drug/metabolite transporter (DMT)-like permease